MCGGGTRAPHTKIRPPRATLAGSSFHPVQHGAVEHIADDRSAAVAVEAGKPAVWGKRDAEGDEGVGRESWLVRTGRGVDGKVAGDCDGGGKGGKGLG